MFHCSQKHTWTFGRLRCPPQPMRTDQKLEVSFLQQFIFLLLFSRKLRSEMYDNALCDSQAHNFLRGIHPPRPRQYLFLHQKSFFGVRVCMAVVEIDRCTGVSASTAHYICLLFGQMRLRSFAEGKLLFCFCSFKQPKLKQGWI